MTDDEKSEGAGKRLSDLNQSLDDVNSTAPAASEQVPWPTSKLEWALWNARHLGRVFPARDDDKLPAIKDNLRRATRDEAQIRAWFANPMTGESNNRNIGLVCDGGESGFVVVDLDPGNNPDVLRQFGILLDMWTADPTLVVDTPAGGRHYYFRTVELIGTSAHTNKFLQGLDTRASGTGYVLGVGSTRTIQTGKSRDDKQERAYAIRQSAPIAPMPKQLAAALRCAPPSLEPPAGKDPPLVELDQQHNIQHAIEYLEKAKPADAQGSRNQRTNRVAFRVGDFAISEQKCIELMTDHWLPRCHAAWTIDDMLPPIASAYKRRKTPRGSGVAEVQFPPLPEETAAPADALPASPDADDIVLPEISADYGYRVVDFEDEDDFSTFRDPLVTGVIDQQRVGVVYGKSHIGKSFVLMRMAWHIAAGEPWAGQFVTQGPVLYISTEGDEGVLLRKAALRKMLGKRPLPLRFISLNISLGAGGEKAAKRIIKEARLFERKTGRMPILIVIDTVSAAMMGVKISEGGDISAIINRMRQVALVTGAACIGVGHTGKNEDNGPLGSYLWTANVDTQAQVRAGEIEVQKKRDGMKAPLLGFVLDDVDLGRTATGQPLNSAVARMLDRPQENLAATERGLRDDLRGVLQLLRSMSAELDRSLAVIGLSLKSLAKESMARGMREGKSEKSVEDSMRKALKRLAELGLAKAHCGLWLPTETQTAYEKVMA